MVPTVIVADGEDATTVTAIGGVELTLTSEEARADPPGPEAVIV